MRGLGAIKGKQQIPCGDDRKKGKSRSKRLREAQPLSFETYISIIAS